MKLSDATKIMAGASEAAKIYLGSDELWASGGGAFNPLDISGIMGWWDVTQLTGKEYNDSINLLPNLAAANHNLVQTEANTLAWPLYRYPFQNDLPALEQKANSFLYTTAEFVNPKTFVIVACCPSATFAGYNGLLNGMDWSDLIDGNPGTANLYTAELPEGGVLYKDGVQTSLNFANAWHIYTLTVTADMTTRLKIGKGSYNTWYGYFSEMLVFDSVLTGDDFTNLHNWLKTKYALQ